MKKLFIFFTVLLTFVLMNAQSYYFGQNKVNYTAKKWEYVKTEHFDIYFYQGSQNLVSFAAMVAESSITYMENVFKYSLKNRVPIIIYKSHKDFEETNITIEILDEFVGGFTESLKNRVVVPFDGSYADFRHVINHELTHALQFDILYGKGGAGIVVSSISYDIPLWFIEGSAEYFSREWDRETDMYMRDAVFNDEFVDLETLGYYYGGYIIYKEGQAVHKYIADTYGEQKIVAIYRSIKNTRSFNKSLRDVIGIDIKELDKDFKLYLKKRYAALYNTKDDELKNSKSLLGKFKETSPYNVSPSLSPDGNYVAFISEKYGFFDIYMMRTGNPEYKWRISPRTLIRNYESFHLKQGNLNWSSDSKWMLYSVRNKGNERIAVYDIEKKKQVLTVDIKADGLFSPVCNMEKTEIAFTVMRDGKTDISLYDIESKEEINITNDIYDDINPHFYRDQIIIFSSTRPFGDDEWDYQTYRLFEYNLNTGNIRLLTDSEMGSIVNFNLFRDSMIVFESDITDISNIFTMNMNSGEVKQLTDVMTGVFDPSISQDGSTMTVRFLKSMEMDICLITNPLKNSKPVDFSVSMQDYARIFFPYTYTSIQGVKPPLRISFDWLAGAFSYSPGYGFIGLLDAAVSDIMGNNRLYVQMEKLSTTGNGFITVQYWNMKNRINYALMYLNLQSEYMEYYYNPLLYRTKINIYNGVGGIISYPFDRFNRFDFELDFYDYSVYTNDVVYGYSTRYKNYDYFSTSVICSYVHDNTVWGYYGPVNGEVWRIDVGNAFMGPGITNTPSLAFIAPEYRFTYINTDFRKYIILTSRSQIALKFAGISYFGPEYYPAMLGGTGTIRGYPYGMYYGQNVYYSNIELRFPLIDQIRFSLPGFIFGNIRGVVFTDFGFAKDDLSDLRIFTEQYVLDDLKMGYGAGIRMDIWFAILKLDVAKHTDLRTASSDYYWHLDFGAEF